VELDDASPALRYLKSASDAHGPKQIKIEVSDSDVPHQKYAKTESSDSTAPDPKYIKIESSYPIKFDKNTVYTYMCNMFLLILIKNKICKYWYATS
jgi:hypothetical protein